MGTIITYNNIVYEHVKQSEQGICSGCAFSGKLKNSTNLKACSKYGKDCITDNTGNMLIYIKSKNQIKNIDLQTGQLSLF